MTDTMRLSRMRASVFACASLIALLAANRAFTQILRRVGPFVVDLHATVPRFPQDLQLAESRDMTLAELPGSGLGVLVGVHFYPLRWRAVTFGLGGEFATGRSRQTPTTAQTAIRPATERLTTITPQLSFNFGTGSGWSYISGGLGRSTWAVTPQDRKASRPTRNS